MKINKPKGTYDLFGKEIDRWQSLENTIRTICRLFNYKEIRTPLFERSEVFHRSVGETTDIVSKETYDFTDRGKRSMTLRPEGTAAVVRSYVENKLYASAVQPNKFYYMQPMFRYEQPQAGRYRQHNQFGVEVLGSPDPLVDAEIISLVHNLFAALGLKGVKVMINTLGDAESKLKYKSALIEYFTPYTKELCNDCKTRLAKNPLRVLDCKVDSKKEFFGNAPRMVDFLNESSEDFFNQLQAILKELGVDYEINHNLVRGIDYYTHTIFEIQADIEGFGSQNTLCGGGRYNKLVNVFDGPETPGIGFGMGMERLLLALEMEEINITNPEYIHAYVAPLCKEAKPKALEIANSLRMQGLISEVDMLERKMKAHFKQAERQNARFIVFIGEEELSQGKANIKDLQTKEQVTVTLDKVFEYIYKELTNQKHCGSCKGN